VPVPSLFRGFSAPVKVKGISLDRLKFLAAHDSDPFARWEAGQQVATRHLLALVADWRQGRTLVADSDLLDALRRTLLGGDADPAFAAMALALPGEPTLADEMDIVDVEAIHEARQFLRAEIGRNLGGELVAVYERLTDHGPYRIDPRAIGGRALRNGCLAYLAVTGEVEATRRLVAQFDAANNMTDRLAALALLSDIPGDERDHAFETFYVSWRHDDLVIDKWFALQATCSLPDSLQRCKALLDHPDFDMKNPNRVRSLVGAFSQANQLRFHEASGAGYAFLADRIVELDRFNATMAARLTQPLGAWRRYDAGRQELMRKALETVLAVPGLSKGTFEMASKSLQ
jgi:aminopeptidase N